MIDWTRDLFEERAAIREYEGSQSRAKAEVAPCADVQRLLARA